MFLGGVKIKKFDTRRAALAGVVAALYVILTYISAAFGLAYGPLQFRLSEALTILPAVFPEAIPGLALGCLISNFASPLGAIDIIFGTLATLAAAILARCFRKVTFRGIPVLSPLAPALVNAFYVAFLLTFFVPENASTAVFWTTFFGVFASEAVVCYLLGLPANAVFKKVLQKNSTAF